MNPHKTIKTLCVTAVAISPTGSRVAVGLDHITIWDVHTETKRFKPLIQGHDIVRSLAFSLDDRNLVSGFNDGTIHIWDVASVETVLPPLRGHTERVSCVDFSHDGRFVASGSNDRTLRIWDTSTGQQTCQPVVMGTSICSIAVSRANDRIVCGLSNGEIRTYIIDLEYLVTGLSNHMDSVFSIAFSPDGSQIASGSRDQNVCLWDGRAVKVIGDVFRGHTSDVMCVAFSPDGRYIASGSLDPSIRIWDLETGTLKNETTNCHKSSLRAVAFTADGRWLISCSCASIILWDLSGLGLSTLPVATTEYDMKHGETITSLTAPEDIMDLLAKRGCKDITNELDLTSCGKYPISTGGFGDIYRGKLQDNTEIAIKTTRIYADSGEQSRKSFKHAARELYTWAKCQHPNVQRLLGLVLFRDQIGMISAWESNGDLPHYLSRHPGADRCDMSTQISEGLSYLHEFGIIHGDLKGGNVLVSGDGVPRLTDFGNAALREYTIRFTQSSTESVKSLRWAAPELFKSGSRSYEADVWALGMTILETITCEVPYSEKSEPSLIFAIMFEMALPERPLEYIPVVSLDGDTLWSLLRSCWEFESSRRPSALYVKTVMKSISASGLRRR